MAPTDGRHSYETLRVLSKTYKVHVFYPRPAYSEFWKPGNLKKLCSDKFQVPGVSVSYHDYRAIPLLSRPFNGAVAAASVLRDVRAFDPDLILSFSLYPGGYAALQVGRELAVPVVAVAVGSDVHNIPDPFTRMHTRDVLRKLDFLVTVSEDLRRRALTLGARAEASRTVRGGCDLSVFRPRDRTEARNRLGIETGTEAVLYVGRLDARKGLRELVHAASLLQPTRSQLHVYVVGDGPDRPLIEKSIRTYGACAFVHLVHGCSFQEVSNWLAAADVFTLPSYMEGCPNTVMEALACGRPVVATSVGGIPEILNEQCGLLIPPRDSHALAEALRSALERDWNSAAISSHWSRNWAVSAKDLGSTLESVMRENNL
jgi:glycosyltransferase involved in cell wall biosynthesis